MFGAPVIQLQSTSDGESDTEYLAGNTPEFLQKELLSPVAFLPSPRIPPMFAISNPLSHVFSVSVVTK